ncbi:hypothetical protein GDO78_019621 [Eleutherodactylus coqui]|uniref:Uncharacterized protein n=1 Tax=Eleutherodactylus coqui TaxID=57060 RepID=A0A8J6BCF6_ELECQ|nr:hypothetical protein GDO78_019621 [Eleutherodactylus coqui]
MHFSKYAFFKLINDITWCTAQINIYIHMLSYLLTDRECRVPLSDITTGEGNPHVEHVTPIPNIIPTKKITTTTTTPPVTRSKIHQFYPTSTSKAPRIKDITRGKEARKDPNHPIIEVPGRPQ